MSASGPPDPLVPPIPSSKKHRGKYGPKRNDARAVVWLLALAIGIGAGIGSYRYVPAVKKYFAYWEARVLS
jgi:hypothetical protein